MGVQCSLSAQTGHTLVPSPTAPSATQEPGGEGKQTSVCAAISPSTPPLKKGEINKIPISRALDKFRDSPTVEPLPPRTR